MLSITHTPHPCNKIKTENHSFQPRFRAAACYCFPHKLAAAGPLARLAVIIALLFQFVLLLFVWAAGRQGSSRTPGRWEALGQSLAIAQQVYKARFNLHGPCSCWLAGALTQLLLPAATDPVHGPAPALTRDQQQQQQPACHQLAMQPCKGAAWRCGCSSCC